MPPHDPTSPPDDPPLRLPFSPRPGQMQLVEAARAAFREGRQAVLEAGTGTGKTVAVLTAALDEARRSDRKVLYLTRTHSQQRQAIVEFRRIVAGLPGRPPLALALQGRAHLCPELGKDTRYRDATPDEYSRLCGTRKRASLDAHGVHDIAQAWDGWPGAGDDDHAPDSDPPDVDVDRSPPAAVGTLKPHDPGAARTRLPMADPAGCPYYDGLLDSDPRALLAELATDPVPSETLAGRLESRGICPYEATKALLPEALLVVAPYIYLADPRLAHALTEWLRRPLDDCIVIVDEAHNLPDYLRQLHSPELGLETLQRARTEAASLSDPKLFEGCTATRLVDLLAEALEEATAEHVPGDADDALLPPDEVPTRLMSALRTTSRALEAASLALMDLGEQVREREQRAGKLPRSYLGAIGGFLQAWQHAVPAEHVHIVVRDPGPRFVLYCLDPSLGAGFLTRAHAAIHISGTLRPLDQYRDVLALPSDTVAETIPSPYPPEHLQVVLVDDVTTRWDTRVREPETMDRLHAHLERLLATEGANTAVFFPSYGLLRGATELGLAQTGRRRVFTEGRDLDQKALMGALDRFRAEGAKTRTGGPGAVWLGVVGGRVSEGMDFPGPSLEALALVGLPYPKPTARQRALVRFHDIRHGRGWQYAVEAPTTRRVMQAIGRVVRDEADRGIVFLLDDRFRRLADHLPRMERLGDDEQVDQRLQAWLRARDGPALTPRPPRS